MLSSKQRSYLRSLANTIAPIFQIGKGGINENMIRQINEALEVRELIKATVLNNAQIETKVIAQEISKETRSELVQVIGNKFVLYKESRENKAIVLPK